MTRMVQLAHSHIIIDSTLAKDFFGEDQQVCWVFYPQRQTLLLAAAGDELFQSLHKTSKSMLKLRNNKGDRSIPVPELIIDHNLNDTDRSLEFYADKKMHILNIYF